MFRIVKDFVEQPSFLLMCDRRTCAATLSCVVDPEFTERAESQAAFVEAAQMAGWKFGIDEQVCPDHLKAEQEARPRITVPQVNFLGAGKRKAS